MTSPEQPTPKFFLLLVAAATVLLGLVIYPMVNELFLAAVLAGVLGPAQRGLAKRLGGRRGTAAGLLTAAVVILLLGPLATVTTFIVRDGNEGVRFVSETARGPRVTALLQWLPAAARDVATDAIDHLPKDVGEVVGQVGAKGGRAAAAVGARFALHAGFMLIALFFLLVRGEELVSWLDSVSPLEQGQTRELFAAFKRVSYAVIVSTLVTGAAQAVAALVGYLIARVPNPVFFATMTFFLAFIPAIGAGVVCVAAAALLFLTGHPYLALFLAVWGIVVVGLVDNVVKPLLIRRGMELHGAVVFFAFVGGLAAFGAIGLLVGPLVVSFFLALVRMYHRDFSPKETRIPRVPGLGAGTATDPPAGTPAPE